MTPGIPAHTSNTLATYSVLPCLLFHNNQHPQPLLSFEKHQRLEYKVLVNADLLKLENLPGLFYSFCINERLSLASRLQELLHIGQAADSALQGL